MTLRAQVLSALKWSAAARILAQVVTWGITILVMRQLSPDDYGLLALATIFVGLLSLIAEIGLSSGIVQAETVEPQDLRIVFGAVIVMNVALCLVTAFVLAPLSASYFDEPRLTNVMRILGLQFLPNALTVVPIALLERELQFRGRSLVDFASAVGAGVITLVLAYRGFGVWALVWGNLAQIIVRAAGLNAIRPFLHLPSFRFSSGGRLFRFGRDVVFTRLLWFLYSQADSFVAGKVLGTHSLGLYSVSMHLASLPVQRASAIVNQVAFAAFARANRQAGRVDFHALKSVRALSFFAFPTLWGMSSVAPELIDVLLGASWAPAIQAFMLLCLVMPLRMLSPVVHAALQGVGRVDVSLRNTLFMAIVMPIAFYVGSRFDLLGLALAWVIVFPVVFLANLSRSLPYLDVTLAQFLAAMRQPALISAVMYGGVALTRSAIDTSSAVTLAALVAAGALVYGTLSLAFNRQGVREIWTMIARPTS